MKLKEHYVLRCIADEWYVIPRQEEADRLKSIIPLNDVSAFLWRRLQAEQSVESLTAALTEEYDVDDETAKEAVVGFVEKLQEMGCLQE